MSRVDVEIDEAERSEFDWLKILIGLGVLGGAAWLFARYAHAASSPPLSSSPKEPEVPNGRSPLSPSRSYEPIEAPGHEVFVPEGVTSVPSSSSSSPVSTPGPGEVGLRNGKKYRARLQLSGFERLGSREQIASMFTELGFSNVLVYMNQSELPGGAASWPSPSEDPGARWVEGKWSRANENLPKPPQVVEVREA